MIVDLYVDRLHCSGLGFLELAMRLWWYPNGIQRFLMYQKALPFHPLSNIVPVYLIS